MGPGCRTSLVMFLRNWLLHKLEPALAMSPKDTASRLKTLLVGFGPTQCLQLSVERSSVGRPPRLQPSEPSNAGRAKQQTNFSCIYKLLLRHGFKQLQCVPCFQQLPLPPAGRDGDIVAHDNWLHPWPPITSMFPAAAHPSHRYRWLRCS